MAESTKGQASPKVHFFHITPPTQRSSEWRVKEVREKDAQAFDTYKEALDEAKRRVREVGQGHIVVHDEYGRFDFYEE
jgi:hypothetical protein